MGFLYSDYREGVGISDMSRVLLLIWSLSQDEETRRRSFSQAAMLMQREPERDQTLYYELVDGSSGLEKI